MTADMRESTGEPAESPLEKLLRRIEDARELSPVRTDAAVDAPDPLEAIRRRVESAADFELSADAPAPPAEPLQRLEDRIDRARRKTANGSLEPATPDRPPSSATGDPLQRLRRLLANEIEELESRSTVDLSPRTETSARSQTAESSGVSAAEHGENVTERVGREVLALLEDQPLPGRVRAEAVRRLADALDDPDRESVRGVLRLLLSPPDSDAT